MMVGVSPNVPDLERMHMSRTLWQHWRMAVAGLCLLAGASAAVAASTVTVLVTDAAGQPLAGAVVAVELGGIARAAAPGTRAEIAQRQRSFEPGLVVVQVGTAVEFPNQDTVRHHVYSFSPSKPFELKLYSGRPVAPVVFDQAGVVTLGCNIHDQMVAHVVVVPTPLHGRTDATGRFVLELPAGEHRLRAWHPGMREGADLLAQPIKVGAAGLATVKVVLPVTGRP
jgi:plastocyanin